MFCGIVQKMCKVASVVTTDYGLQISIELEAELIEGLKIGASVAVDGVCLTVVKINGVHAFFDVIFETLERTTLDTVHIGTLVNIERALKYGDEVGGHLVSGHVMESASIVACVGEKVRIQPTNGVLKYLSFKGFVSVDGISLTVSVKDEDYFEVSLIPETLRVTILGMKKVGSKVNLEVDTNAKIK